VNKRFSLILLLLCLALAALAAAGPGPLAAKQHASEDADQWRIELSEEEQAFIRDHPVVTFSDVHWAPLAVIQPDGEYQGVFRDYYDLVEEITGLRFEFRRVGDGVNFQQVLDALKNKSIDMIDGSGRTRGREQYASFAGPFYRFPLAIASRKAQPIKDAAGLQGQRVVAAQGSTAVEFLQEHHPDLAVDTVEDTRQALRMVAAGQADAMLDNLAVTGYAIQKQGLTNVAVTGLADYVFDVYSLVRDDWPRLASILQKAHQAIPDTARQAISDQWTPLAVDSLASSPAALTAQQRIFLENNPVIRASNERNWPPFNFNVNGQPRGFSVDVLNLLADKLGVRVQWVQNKNWDEFMAMLRAGEIDTVCNMAVTPERKTFTRYTDSYATLLEGVAFRPDNFRPGGLSDLFGKRVAASAGFYEVEILKTHYPEIEVVTYESPLDCLQAVSAGKVDAYLGSLPVIHHLMKQYFITNLETVALQGAEHFQAVPIHFGVRHDAPLLREALDRAMAEVAEDEWRELRDKWFGARAEQLQALQLSEAQREHLRSKRYITMCVTPDWPPYETINQRGRHVGMIADAMDLMADRIGAPIRVIPTETWSQSLEFARQRMCDIISAVQRTPAREEYLDFTEPYLSFPYVIAVRSDEMFVEDLEQLAGKRVGVVKDYAVEDILRRGHPELEAVPVDSVAQGLRMVSSGELFGFVDTVASISQAIQKYKLYDLKIAGKLDEPLELSVGVRNDDPLLLDVFNKATRSLSEQDKETIQKKWLSVTFEHGFDYGLLWKVLAGAVVVLAVIVWWNRKLARLHRAVSQARDELEQAHGKLAALLDNSGQCFLSVAPDSVADPECSQECRTIFSGDVAGRSLGELLHPRDEAARANLEKNVQRILQEPDEFRQNLYLSLLPTETTVNGRQVEAEYRVLPGDKLMLVLTDVTERRRLEAALEQERNRLAFVVSAVREPQELFDILDEWAVFSGGELEELVAQQQIGPDEMREMHRKVHTFKGLTLQMEFPEFPAALNDLESRLGRLAGDEPTDASTLREAVRDAGLEQALDRDLNLLEEALGREFFEQRGQISLPRERVEELEHFAEQLLAKAGELGLDESERRMLARVRDLKLVPARRLLAGYPKAALQLAQRLDKRIQPFVVQGGEVLVDPDRYGPLTKTLVHVFRNAVDHGIESSEERLEAGKPEEGRLACRVMEQDGRLVIEIEDDGRGLDLQAVRAKAASRGLVSLEQAQAMDDDKAAELMFEDGFSTAEEAGMVSGRGVGLAAVQAETARLHGRIDIDTEPGRFTRIRVAIPLEH
jgi:ABC-type amino acid transport substrate-binding protein/two-component sensor histidine kinase